MRRTTTHAIRCLLLALAGAASVAAAAELPRYSCQRLGGSELRGQLTYSGGINSLGEVAGTGQFSRQEAVLTAAHWQGDGSVDFLVRSHRNSGAYSINDAGQVVGYVTLADGGTRPAVWANGQASLLPTLAGRKGSGVAVSVNNQGQIAGVSSMRWVGRWRQRATLWEHGKAINLGTIDPNFDSRAIAINDRGVAVGFSDVADNGRRAVQWSGHVMTELAPLRGGARSEALGLNRDGVVVGASNTADNVYYLRAVAWQEGQVLDLGTLPGDMDSQAEAINAQGVIVGQSSIGFGPSTAVAWFGIDAAPVDLNGLIADGGCHDDDGNVRLLSEGTGINEQGAIAATSYTAAPNGRVQVMAFRLTPL